MISSKTILNKLKRIAYLAIVFTTVFTTCYTPFATAISDDQRAVYDNSIYFFDLKDCGLKDEGDAGAGGGVAGGAGIWNSGLQPPYILEQWAIESLKAIASKKGVDAATVVTEEHVVALVAFAIGEGGDIANSGLFNPLNSGLNAPELLATDHNASGLQAYKSFDAGVEANARMMTGNNQSRLGNILVQPGSTAQQFMEALTYFNRYPGNKLWAEASTANPAGYYQQRLALIQQVRGNWEGTAALIIGTPAREQKEHLTDPSKLQFHPQGSGAGGGAVGGGAADATGANECTSGDKGAEAGNGDIVKTALALAWPPPADDNRKVSTPAYMDAFTKYEGAGGVYEHTDCGRFVSTVMQMSGVDPDYPKVGTGVMGPYLESHPDKYEKIGALTDVSQLKPGDILIKPGVHTEIFVGDQGGGINTAGASLGDHTPQQNGPGEMAWLVGNGFTAYRAKGGAGAANTAIKPV